MYNINNNDQIHALHSLDSYVGFFQHMHEHYLVLSFFMFISTAPSKYKFWRILFPIYAAENATNLNISFKLLFLKPMNAFWVSLLIKYHSRKHKACYKQEVNMN